VRISRGALIPERVYRQVERHPGPGAFEHRDGADLIARVAPLLARVVGDAPVEQKQFYGLQSSVNSCRSISPYRRRCLSAPPLQGTGETARRYASPPGHGTHVVDALALLLSPIETLVGVQLGLDLLVVGSERVSVAPSCRAALRLARAKSSIPSSAIKRAAAAAIRVRICSCLNLVSLGIRQTPPGRKFESADHTSADAV